MQSVDRGKGCLRGGEESFQRRHPIGWDAPGTVKIPGQSSFIPAEMPGDLRERHAQGPPLGLQALGEGLSGRGVGS